MVGYWLLSVYYNLQSNPQISNTKMKNAIVIQPATYVAIPDHLQSNFTEPKGGTFSYESVSVKYFCSSFVEGSMS